MSKEVKLTRYNNNAAIKMNILSEAEMRKAGFTDYNPFIWYFCKGYIGNCPDISFSVSINKSNPSDWRIDVLDENFLQPYDYQYMIENKTPMSLPYRVKEDVEKWMKHLSSFGIIKGHEYGDYI